MTHYVYIVKSKGYCECPQGDCVCTGYSIEGVFRKEKDAKLFEEKNKIRFFTEKVELL